VSKASSRQPIVIAIDGPAASGKGTLARRLAAIYGFAHLDTGALYRGIAAALLAQGADPADEAPAVKAARALDLSKLDERSLRSDETGKAAGIVAAIPAVRAAILDRQRSFASHPPGGEPGVVLDGRDTGTVICPDASVKLFVTASLDVRARRRALELRGRGIPVDEAVVRADIAERDQRDMSRAVAPLKRAADAHLLDTSTLDIEAAVAAARAIIDRVLQSGCGSASGSRPH
jgi:cytidylate kinase